MSEAKFSCEIEQLPKGEGWRLVMCENGKEVVNDTFAAFPRMDAKKRPDTGLSRSEGSCRGLVENAD